jgi:hypothetical protein
MSFRDFLGALWTSPVDGKKVASGVMAAAIAGPYNVKAGSRKYPSAITATSCWNGPSR